MARKRALRRRIVVAILVVLSVALLTVYFRESSDGPVHQAEASAMHVVAPLQSGTARVIKPFRDGWNWMTGLFGAQSQNRTLRAEVQQLRGQLAQQLVQQQQTTELHGLLQMRDSSVFPRGTNFADARVIARSTTAWYSTVTIDAGSDQGVRLNDAVVNGQGLVGRVSAVTPDASEVTLITDQDSYVDSMVVPSGAQGMLAGSVTGDVTLQYVDRSEKVVTGQDVVTSGMKGSIFTRGIPIGQVSAVAQQDVELYQSISVTPWVDFHTLDLVMVAL
ncbi:MAG TPA: rod shape-determining protein MreC [Thermoleophilia bacterium]|nr:rod shape-determining protein MreC [Thermoleophilia bacterium]